MRFSDRFSIAATNYSPFCVGLDPSKALLRSWDLPFDKHGLWEFSERVLDAASGKVAAIKPQVAFFEMFGPDGFFVLKDVIKAAKERDLLVIADAKRGDIGHSVKAYAKAWFGKEQGFSADALTVHAYLGYEALFPLIEYAETQESGVFVVVRSSNPEGRKIQHANIHGEYLFDDLAKEIQNSNKEKFSHHPIGPVGAVIGATSEFAARKSIETLTRSLFLVPGLGTQGGTFEDIEKLFQGAFQRVIPTSSRKILEKGPDSKKLSMAISSYAEAAKRLYDLT